MSKYAPGYAGALLAKDIDEEKEELEKKAEKKGIWGSLGRTLGSIVAMAVTGGLANPWTVGALHAGLSAAGGAAGSALSRVDLSGGKFFQSEREDLASELSPFGSENITGAITSGVTAGMGKAAKLQMFELMDKPIETVPFKFSDIGSGKNIDFKGSFIGKSDLGSIFKSKSKQNITQIPPTKSNTAPPMQKGVQASSGGSIWDNWDTEKGFVFPGSGERTFGGQVVSPGSTMTSAYRMDDYIDEFGVYHPAKSAIK